MATAYSLPYHEPDIVTILTLSTFILALNVVNYILDRLIYCGLLGQIFLGILWGTPGAKWLSEGSESVMVNLGYLGLILLVYEGGLSTSFKSLKSNLGLSVGVACTGVGLPIALSYVLLRLADATPLQAFASGAALCSTSLGTTFTVLETSGLINTRMGVVLASAAMMDDVVGLVMVQVITKLGASSSSSSSFSSITVIRPVFVSLAFALVVPVVARLIIKPATVWLNMKRDVGLSRNLEVLLSSSSAVLAVHSIILLGLVTGSSYAGTSNLFAAYLAGAAISWWDSEVAHPKSKDNRSSKAASVEPKAPVRHTGSNETADSDITVEKESTSGEEIFKRFFKPGLESILRPLFFASIGFSIPIRQMFTGTVVWRGMVYVMLMALGKLVCGIWLIRLPAWTLRKPRNQQLQASKSGHVVVSEHISESESRSVTPNTRSIDQVIDSSDAIRPECNRLESSAASNQQPARGRGQGQEQAAVKASNISRPLSAKKSMQHPHNVQPISKPLSLYPAAIVGCAMISRGEIGFLISSLAESNGIFRSSRGKEQSRNGESQAADQIFLVVTWAIMLCTIIGPILVGLMVRRMNRLEKNAIANGIARENVLGVWG